MMDYLTVALAQLAPGKQYVNRGDHIEWFDNPNPPEWSEINALISTLRAAEPMRCLREERDKRLQACDWVVVKSTETGAPIPQAWLDYRQALRDLPANSSPQLWPTDILIMESVGWPTPPQG